MTPQPPPPPRSPEQVAGALIKHFPNPRGYAREAQLNWLRDAIASELQSKQDEIDKLRTRAENAERDRNELQKILEHSRELAGVHKTESLSQAILDLKHERDEALEALKWMAERPHPETMPGAHLSEEARGQLAFAALDEIKRRAKEIIDKLKKK